ncbi:MAG TPA: hypothetical protein VID75_05525 [Acidimicrobiales bacterium]|jgi:hypothetical protein
MASTATARITRGDLEAKLREVTGEATESVEAVRPQLIGSAVGALLLAVIVAYLFGRRRGRKRSAVVEIRRV